jgi:hypothetical protein
MRLVTMFAALLLHAGAAPALAESADALFAKYPATVKFKGKPAAVDLKSHKDAPNFRTRLRDAVKEAKGPNFAGHMIATLWGCGTSCQMVALIDARNGKVYFAPEPAAVGVEYRADSRLMIFNPPKNLKEAFGDKPPQGMKTEMYVWEKGALTKVK